MSNEIEKISPIIDDMEAILDIEEAANFLLILNQDSNSDKVPYIIPIFKNINFFKQDRQQPQQR